MKKRDFYGVDYKFYGDINVNPPYIGFELEINSIGSENEKNNKLNNFINDFEPDNSRFGFKGDMSIGVYGVEIVSHPGTINWHKTDGFVQEIFEKINKHEMNFGRNCGLHFHVDIKFFTQNEIAALDYFVNRPEVMKRLAYVGGRDLNVFCPCESNKRWGNLSMRRMAMNIVYKTIEFRFCNSTSSIEEFFKRMELIYCLSHFSKVITTKEIFNCSGNECLDKFLKFVKIINPENLKVEDFNGERNIVF